MIVGMFNVDVLANETAYRLFEISNDESNGLNFDHRVD